MEGFELKVARLREVGTILELIEDTEIEQEYNFEEHGAEKMKAAIVEKLLAYMLTVFAGYHESASTMEELELPWKLVRRKETEE